MRRSRVVLPQPEGPMREMNSPRETSRETSERARKVLSRFLYSTETRSTVTTGWVGWVACGGGAAWVPSGM